MVIMWTASHPCLQVLTLWATLTPTILTVSPPLIRHLFTRWQTRITTPLPDRSLSTASTLSYCNNIRVLQSLTLPNNSIKLFVVSQTPQTIASNSSFCSISSTFWATSTARSTTSLTFSAHQAFCLLKIPLSGTNTTLRPQPSRRFKLSRWPPRACLQASSNRWLRVGNILEQVAVSSKS